MHQVVERSIDQLKSPTRSNWYHWSQSNSEAHSSIEDRAMNRGGHSDSKRRRPDHILWIRIQIHLSRNRNTTSLIRQWDLKCQLRLVGCCISKGCPIMLHKLFGCTRVSEGTGRTSQPFLLCALMCPICHRRTCLYLARISLPQWNWLPNRQG